MDNALNFALAALVAASAGIAVAAFDPWVWLCTKLRLPYMPFTCYSCLAFWFGLAYSSGDIRIAFLSYITSRILYGQLKD